MKKTPHTIPDILKDIRSGTVRFFFVHPLGFLFLFSLFLNLLLEILGRRSFSDALGFLLLHPYPFAVNALIIFTTLSVSLLFRRRVFVFSFLSALWGALGIANCILMNLRNSPLSAIDFGMIRSCLSILTVYLKIRQIAALGCAVLLFLVGMVFLFRRCGKQKRLPYCGLPNVLFPAVLLCTVLTLSLRLGALSTEFPDLPGAYADYGFPYCFSVSVLDRGVRRPKDYSDTEIDAILSAIESDTEPEADRESIPESAVLPNVVMIQLESFFDVNRLNNVGFSDNPVPVFSRLTETCPSGFLTVPSIGAGTANTEFEILTGMNLDDFGAGEYPYKTILHDTACESAAFNLKALGYRTHALHNHSGTFYDRNEVYASLGFDTFTSLEYMENPEYNPLGWAKDKVLIGEILSVLNSTEERDFVFTVSVQAHGRYPDEAESEESGDTYEQGSLLEKLFSDDAAKETEKTGKDTVPANEITVSGISDPGLLSQFTYYVNQIHEVDTFLGALISSLSAYPEPILLVLYGDHLPALSLTSGQFGDGSGLYQTEYVLWSNTETLDPVREDLYAYQLSAAALDYAGIHEGVLTKLHQNHRDEDTYRASLEMLEYDMLYGDMEIWNGINPYLPTRLQMGTYPVTVSGVYAPGSHGFYVMGAHFTEFSCVTVNEKRMDTEFVDASTLFVPDAVPESGDLVAVIQAGDDRIPLGESNTVMVP